MPLGKKMVLAELPALSTALLRGGAGSCLPPRVPEVEEHGDLHGQCERKMPQTRDGLLVLGSVCTRKFITQGFSTLFYYKDRFLRESATSTTQQVRALYPQHMPKFKNMLQRAQGSRQHYKPSSICSLKVTSLEWL